MPHEEAIVISPLDEKMEQDLVKANVTDAVISALKEKYGNLRLRSVDDKETYLEIKDAKKDCAKLRNIAVKVCKEGREQAVAIQKKWVAKQNEVVGHIEQVENPLDAEIERFDAEVTRKEQEEKQRQETMYMQRTQALTKMGALYSDNSFALGDFSLEANLVKESSKEVWDEEILPKFNEQFFILEAERIEQEKVKAEKEAELKRQQEELLEKQREFEAQQAKFKAEQERIAKEAEEKRRVIVNKRSAQLSELGLKYNGREYYLNGANIESKGIVVNADAVSTMSDDDFSNIIKEVQPAIEHIKQEEAENIAAKIEAQKKHAEEMAAQRERQRIEEENRQAELKRQQEEQRKAEELAKAGDKALWTDFLQKLDKITVPKLKSGQYNRVGNIAKQKLEEILALKPY